MSDQQPRKKIFDFALLKRVFRFARPYKKKFYTSLTLSVVLAVFAPIRPYLVQLTINSYVKGGMLVLPANRNPFVEMVITVTIIQIVLLLIESVVRFYFSYITAWLGQHVVKDMRVQVYNKILGLNLSQFDKTPIGTLTTRTINDIESINDIFSDGLYPSLQIYFLLFLY